MWNRIVLSFALFAFAAAGSGCYTPRILAPRSAPAPIMPHVRLPTEQPAAGSARVVIDSTDGPMDVTARGASRETASAKLNCRTPCVAELPLGSYNLSFSNLASDSARGDRARVDLLQGVNVVRNAPGQYRVPPSFQWPSFLLGLGGTGLLVGGLVVAGNSSIDSPVPGVAMLTTGVGLLVAAVVVHQYVAHQQAGATTTFLASPEN